MTNPYDTQTISNYNTSPPADDATAAASNQLFWSKHKDKLADPIKTLAEAINTELLDSFNQLDLNQIRSISANDTQLAADERKLISATGTITYTLLPAGTAADGFTVTVLNAGTGVITVEADTSELINDALNLALNLNEAVKLRSNGTSWDIVSLTEPIFVLKDNSELTIATGSVTPTANYHSVDTEADAASDALTDIVTTNIPDGGMLLIRANHTDRSVVVTHTASGAGKIVTVSGSNITLDDAVKSVQLQRRGDHWEQVASGEVPGGLIGFQTITATGTYTPTAGTNSAFVELKGAGGGGGGADSNATPTYTGAGGGGEGEQRLVRITSLGATETVTINSGGAGGSTSGGNGAAGGTTVFGAHATANGGAGGIGTGAGADEGTMREGGIGGTGGSGGFGLNGQAGAGGAANQETASSNERFSVGGVGGGNGGGAGGATAVDGANGGGGGGARSVAIAGAEGGAGGDGYALIWEYS